MISPEFRPWLWRVLALLRERMTCPVALEHLNRMSVEEQLTVAWREAQAPLLTLPSFVPVGPFERARVGA